MTRMKKGKDEGGIEEHPSPLRWSEAAQLQSSFLGKVFNSEGEEELVAAEARNECNNE
jgi:hypothetical protein